MPGILRVLIVEDNPDDSELMVMLLTEAGFQVDWQRVDTEVDFLDALSENCDLILSDWRLPKFSGLAALHHFTQSGLDIPFIIVSGSIGEEAAIDAIHQGAADYVLKDRPARLGQAVKRALEDNLLRQEQARTDLALRNSERKYRSLFENVPDGVYRTTLAGKILAANPACVKMLGFESEEELQKVSTFDLYNDPGERNKFTDQITIGELRNQEIFLKCRDGQVIYCLENSHAIRDESGAVLYLEGTLIDITHRKYAEQRIERLLKQQIAANQLSLSLGQSNDLEDVYQIIYTHVKDLMDVEAFAISHYVADEEMIYAQFLISEGSVIDASKLPALSLTELGKGTQSQVIHSGKPFYTPDYRETVGKSHKESTYDKDGVVMEGPPPEDVDSSQSVLYVPMKDKGETIGVMQVQSYRLDAYSQDDIDLLSALANVASLAIQNARLFSDTRRHLSQLQALRSIDQAISGSVSLPIVLNVILEQVIDQLEIDAADVLLYRESLCTLEYSVGHGFQTDGFQSTSLKLGEGRAGTAALERRAVYSFNLFEEEDTLSRSQEIKAEKFVSHCGIPLIAKGKLIGILELFNRSKLNPAPEWFDFLNRLATQAAIAIDSANLFGDLQKASLEIFIAYDSTLEGWAKALELKDMETEGHCQRVVDLTLKVAQSFDIRDKELANIRRGALLHDIGKMGVPDSILQKSGPLTDEEWAIMRQHPVNAYNWLSSIQYLKNALDIPYYHHERWDGTGYPKKLAGEKIPLAARIFAIVDVWDALLSDRPYRKAWSRAKTIKHIKEQSGKHFDPRVVELFLKIVAEEK